MTANELACLRSHATALIHAKANNLPYIAIFEDDVLFEPNFEADFKATLKAMPKYWHILYLGGSFARKPIYFSREFDRMVVTWGAFAYIVNSNCYDLLITEILRANKIVDGTLIDLQKTLICIKPKMKLVHHPEGVSTIKEKYVNYQNIV